MTSGLASFELQTPTGHITYKHCYY